MSSRRFLLVVGAPALPPQIAVGPEFANRCVDLATVRAATTGQNSKLIELTSDQWQFLPRRQRRSYLRRKLRPDPFRA